MNIPLPGFVTNWINRNKKLWLIAAYTAVLADIANKRKNGNPYPNWIENNNGDSFMLHDEDLLAVLLDRLTEVKASITND